MCLNFWLTLTAYVLVYFNHMTNRISIHPRVPMVWWMQFHHNHQVIMPWELMLFRFCWILSRSTQRLLTLKLILQPFQLCNRVQLFRIPCFIGLNFSSGRMIHLQPTAHPLTGEFRGSNSRSVSSLVHSFTFPLGSKDWVLIQYMLIIIVLNVWYNILKKGQPMCNHFVCINWCRHFRLLPGFGFFQNLLKPNVVRCRGLVSQKNIQVYLVDLYFLIRNLRWDMFGSIFNQLVMVAIWINRSLLQKLIRFFLNVPLLRYHLISDTRITWDWSKNCDVYKKMHLDSFVGA